MSRACCRYVDEVYWPQAKEINNLYQPDLLWSDGDAGNSTWWKSAELLAWLYNEAPNKENVVVNDRWGSVTTMCDSDEGDSVTILSIHS